MYDIPPTWLMLPLYEDIWAEVLSFNIVTVIYLLCFVVFYEIHSCLKGIKMSSLISKDFKVLLLSVKSQSTCPW